MQGAHNLGSMRKVVGFAVLLLATDAGCLEENPQAGASVDPAVGGGLEGLFLGSKGATALRFSADGQFAHAPSLKTLLDDFTFDTATSRGRYRMAGADLVLTFDE